MTTQEVLSRVDWELLEQQWKTLGRAEQYIKRHRLVSTDDINGLWEFLGHLICAHDDETQEVAS